MQSDYVILEPEEEEEAAEPGDELPEDGANGEPELEEPVVEEDLQP